MGTVMEEELGDEVGWNVEGRVLTLSVGGGGGMV